MSNFRKTFEIMEKHYIDVPLEIYGNNPYKTLISTLMSARTKDEITKVSAERLFKKAPNIASLSKLSVNQIEKLIYPVGFYKTKAKHIKKVARIIIKYHKSTIPNNKDTLLKLPGVGPKTANLVLNRAFQIPEIAVDTHVHKISNLLGWVNTKTPIETERQLKKILPKKYWPDVNRLMVSLGRQFRSQKKLIEFLKKTLF